MDVNWLTPKAEVREVPGKGFGSFAITPIAAGEAVAGFGGWLMTGAAMSALPRDRQQRSMQVDDDLFMVSGPEAEAGDHVNHSCEPNCGLRGSVVVIAMRDIAIGEELSFDYAMSDSVEYDEFECRCDAPSCRGVITGSDWRDPALQAKYAGFFSPYLASRISGLSDSSR